MRRLPILALLLFVFASGYGTRYYVERRFPEAPPPPGAPRVAADLVPGTLYDVADVKDGDTFTLVGGVDVRLLGIDTPESGGARGVQWYGLEAKRFSRDLLEGRRVSLQPEVGLTSFREKKSRDRFGRALAYVTLDDDTDVNRLLIEVGCSPANAKYKCGRHEEFLAAEAEARAEGLGMWDAEAQAAWLDVHVIPDVPLEEATVLASSSKLLHALDCGIAPAPENATPFRDEAQAAKHGFNRRHSCLEARLPTVPVERARLVASRGSTAVHALGCARVPSEPVYFESAEQAAAFGFIKPHTCITDRPPDVEPDEARFVGTRTSKLLHRADCARGPDADNAALFVSVEQAASFGYERTHECIVGEE